MARGPLLRKNRERSRTHSVTLVEGLPPPPDPDYGWTQSGLRPTHDQGRWWGHGLLPCGADLAILNLPAQGPAPPAAGGPWFGFPFAPLSSVSWARLQVSFPSAGWTYIKTDAEWTSAN